MNDTFRGLVFPAILITLFVFVVSHYPTKLPHKNTGRVTVEFGPTLWMAPKKSVKGISIFGLQPGIRLSEIRLPAGYRIWEGNGEEGSDPAIVNSAGRQVVSFTVVQRGVISRIMTASGTVEMDGSIVFHCQDRGFKLLANLGARWTSDTKYSITRDGFTLRGETTGPEIGWVSLEASRSTDSR